MENRIEATLSTADRQAALDALALVRSKLPFLIDLTPDDRQSLLKMGDKSRAFVAQALTIAEQDDSFLPRSFDTAEMRQDVQLIEALAPIMVAVTQLNEMLGDTFALVGSDAYSAALLVYNALKAKGGNGALDDLSDALGKRFARKSKPKTPSV